MTKTRGGVVSILRDLTLAECRQAYMRLNPDYGMTYTSYEIEGGGSFSQGGRRVSDGEVEIREVFGPADWDHAEIRGWDGEWPKFKTIKIADPLHPQHRPPVSPSMTLEELDARRAAFRNAH
jgi:hypothetical protein